MTSRSVETEYGKFRVTVKDDFDIDYETRTQKKVGISISVGGKKDNCVYITVPNAGNTAKLHNIRVRGLSCTLDDAALGGKKTVAMVRFALTILSEEAPHITHVDLDDNSEFPCVLHDGRQIGISLALYELAFHRSTWYERHFGAVLKNESLRNLYKKDGFFAPKKPTYNFNHKTLNVELDKLYEVTSSWADFFDELYKKDEKCRLLIPWYKDAIKMIMGQDVSFADHTWEIEMARQEKIPYKIVGSSGGARKSTRKNRKQEEQLFDYIDDMNSIVYTAADFA